MALTIDISPELVKRLEEEAAARGVRANDYAMKILEQHLLGVSNRKGASNTDSDAWAVLESMMGTVAGPPDWASGQKQK